MMPAEQTLEEIMERLPSSFTNRCTKTGGSYSSDCSEKEADIAKALEDLKLDEKENDENSSSDKKDLDSTDQDTDSVSDPKENETSPSTKIETINVVGATCKDLTESSCTEDRIPSAAKPRQNADSVGGTFSVSGRKGLIRFADDGKAYHVHTEDPYVLKDGEQYFNTELRKFNNPLLAPKRNPPAFTYPSGSVQVQRGLNANQRRRATPEAPTSTQHEIDFTPADFEQTIQIDVIFGNTLYIIRRNNILHKLAHLKHLVAFKKALVYSRRMGLLHALNAQNELLQTPLFIWATHGSMDGILATITAEPDPNIQGMCVYQSTVGIVRKSRLMSPLVVLSLSKKVDLVTTFIKQAKVNAADKRRLKLEIDQLDSIEEKQRTSGWSALAQVVHSGDAELIEIAKILISEGADPFQKMENHYYEAIDALTIAVKKRESLKFVKPIIDTMRSKNRTHELAKLNDVVSVQFAHENTPFGGTYLDVFCHAQNKRSDFQNSEADAVKELLQTIRIYNPKACSPSLSTTSQQSFSSRSDSSPLCQYSPSTMSPSQSFTSSPEYCPDFPVIREQSPQPVSQQGPNGELLVFDGESLVPCRVTERDGGILNELLNLTTTLDPPAPRQSWDDPNLEDLLEKM